MNIVPAAITASRGAPRGRTTRRDLLLLMGGAFAVLASGCSVPGILAPAGPAAAFPPPGGERIDELGHVLSRCSFGIAPGERAEAGALGIDAWLERQLEPAAIDDDACERLARGFSVLGEPAGELYEYKKEVVARELAQSTLMRAVHSRRQLYEVMVSFWSDHFNIDLSKADCAWLKAADERDVARAHALGRFPDLLRASALSPAMLWYLDGRENRRASPDDRPNENYARELLELHTLGVHGGYSQRDVMEVARCLSGWTVRDRSRFRKGMVEFIPTAHDDGEKLVLGQRIAAGGGAGDLDRVLAIVCAHPSTARHIATKLCRRFIAEDPPAAAVDAVAGAFTASSGDVRAVMRALFACPSFRAEEPELRALRGAKLKRPFHYLASMLRATDAVTDASRQLLDHLAALGQVPFRFPTPDGYPDTAAAWKDGLLWRWKLAAALAANRIPGTRIDADDLLRRAGGADGLARHLLGRAPDPAERRALDAAGPSRALVLLLSSPAFQRC